MSETFTASNGVELDIAPEGHLMIPPIATGLGEMTQCALREFFQHERDQELGRWRWPEDSRYIVYQVDRDQVRVMFEPSGGSVVVRLSSMSGAPSAEFTGAAKAWQKAHAVHHPWHDAKPGEVWVIEWEDPAFAGEEGTAIIVPSSGWDRHLAAKSARRIWPEVSDEA